MVHRPFRQFKKKKKKDKKTPKQTNKLTNKQKPTKKPKRKKETKHKSSSFCRADFLQSKITVVTHGVKSSAHSLNLSLGHSLDSITHFIITFSSSGSWNDKTLNLTLLFSIKIISKPKFHQA